MQLVECIISAVPLIRGGRLLLVSWRVKIYLFTCTEPNVVHAVEKINGMSYVFEMVVMSTHDEYCKLEQRTRTKK